MKVAVLAASSSWKNHRPSGDSPVRPPWSDRFPNGDGVSTSVTVSR